MIRITHPLSSALCGGSHSVLSRFRYLRATLVFIQIATIIFSSIVFYLQQENKIQNEVTNKIFDCIMDTLFYCSHWMILLHVSLMTDVGVDIMLLVHLLTYGLDMHIVDIMDIYYIHQRGLLLEALVGFLLNEAERFAYLFFGVPTYILIVRVLSLTYQTLLEKKGSTTNALWKYLVALAIFTLLQSCTFSLLKFHGVVNIVALNLIRVAMEISRRFGNIHAFAIMYVFIIE